jgi:hypothetical protein
VIPVSRAWSSGNVSASLVFLRWFGPELQAIGHLIDHCYLMNKYDNIFSRYEPNINIFASATQWGADRIPLFSSDWGVLRGAGPCSSLCVRVQWIYLIPRQCSYFNQLIATAVIYCLEQHYSALPREKSGSSDVAYAYINTRADLLRQSRKIVSNVQFLNPI